VAYAPFSNAYNVPSRVFTAGERLLIWLGLIAVWVVLSILIRKDRTEETPE
jgi:hypothetical protein